MVSLAYAGKLNDVFDRIYVHGVAEVPRAELLLWHDNQTKVTKKLLRNVQAAWAKRCEEEWEYSPDSIPQLLQAYSSGTRTFVFVWGGNFDDNGVFQSWFRTLGEVADEESED